LRDRLMEVFRETAVAVALQPTAGRTWNTVLRWRRGSRVGPA
jgi:hypothetical protein